jgi:hypothetical protein
VLFGVLLSIDAPRGKLGEGLPRRSLRRVLRGDLGESEYRYLAEGDPRSCWFRAMEWKGSAVLNRAQFEALVEDVGLVALDTRTLGSLGVPWAAGGLAPAISFDAPNDWCIVSCYVTPLPNRAGSGDFNERDWERVRSAVVRAYRHDPRPSFQGGRPTGRVELGAKYGSNYSHALRACQRDDRRCKRRYQGE